MKLTNFVSILTSKNLELPKGDREQLKVLAQALQIHTLVAVPDWAFFAVREP
jgi:hypothetical protein